MRIDEGSKAIEAYIPHELQEFFEVLVGLSWMPRHQCRAKMEPRDFLTHVSEQFVGLRLGDTTAHSTEHRVTDMLKGDV